MPGFLSGVFMTSMACYVVCTATHGKPEHAFLHNFLLIGCISTPFLFWLTVQSIFKDSWRPRAMHAIVFIVVEGLTLMKHTRFPGPVFGFIEQSPAGTAMLALFPQSFSLAFIGLALHASLSGSKEDLVEGRRSFRKLFLLAAGVYAIGVLLVEIGIKGLPEAPAFLETFHAIVLIGFNLTLGLGSVRLASSILPEPPTSQAPPVDQGVPQEWLERLDRAMIEEEVFREEKLSIRTLALRLNLQEYQLRRLINQGLGYRNFNDYINTHRINASCMALADLKQKGVPVIRIAMDNGFGSLAPFNRAFKAHTGKTPTRYRSDALAARDASEKS